MRSPLALCLALLIGCGNPYVLSAYGSPYGKGGLRGGRHSGVDFRAERGDRAIAAAPGLVVSVSDHHTAGRAVLIGHIPIPGKRSRFRFYTAYLHLDTVVVERGEFVVRGEDIGTVGSTGAGSGGRAHLHLHLCTFPCRIGTGDGDFEGVEDPMTRAAGCFDPRRDYDDETLTYPIVCRAK